MERFTTFLKIYTDGSKCEGKMGCAFYVPCFKYGKEFRITNGSSVFNAELVGILKAFEFLLDKPPSQCIILSDFLSALKAIQEPSDSPIVQEIMYLKFSTSQPGCSCNMYVDT